MACWSPRRRERSNSPNEKAQMAMANKVEHTSITPVPRPKTLSLANLRRGSKSNTSKLTLTPAKTKTKQRPSFTRQSHALDLHFPTSIPILLVHSLHLLHISHTNFQRPSQHRYRNFPAFVLTRGTTSKV